MNSVVRCAGEEIRGKMFGAEAEAESEDGAVDCTGWGEVVAKGVSSGAMKNEVWRNGRQ